MKIFIALVYRMYCGLMRTLASYIPLTIPTWLHQIMLCSTSLSPVKLDILKFDKTFHKFNQEYFCQTHIYGTATSSWTVFLSLTEDFSVWQNLFPVQHYFSLFKLRICWFSTFFFLLFNIILSELIWASCPTVSLNNTRACHGVELRSRNKSISFLIE